MSNLPPLPKIDDPDLYLDVYTHKSVRFHGSPQNEEYGDTDRLAELGEKVFDLAITYALFSQRPLLTAAEIINKRAEVVSDTNIENWIQGYQLKAKLRYTQDMAETINTPEETRQFFHTYIGALYIRNGMTSIQLWISRLINPDAPPTAPPESGVPHGVGQQIWNTPVPPSAPPPPLPNLGPGSGAPSLVSLALVNQTAAQKSIAVTYPAEQSGPSHAPTWTVRCCMNGVERGHGIGKSQKVAKEEAARQAWANMGW